jgi:hypothetical protein
MMQAFDDPAVVEAALVVEPRLLFAELVADAPLLVDPLLPGKLPLAVLALLESEPLPEPAAPSWPEAQSPETQLSPALQVLFGKQMQPCDPMVQSRTVVVPALPHPTHTEATAGANAAAIVRGRTDLKKESTRRPSPCPRFMDMRAHHSPYVLARPAGKEARAGRSSRARRPPPRRHTFLHRAGPTLGAWKISSSFASTRTPRPIRH